MRISDWSSDVCSSDLFLTNVMLGSTVGDVLFEDSPAAAARAMANRAVVSSGLATMSTANEWMPTIKAAVFGIMLFMMPIALLFILTPINQIGRASCRERVCQSV